LILDTLSLILVTFVRMLPIYSILPELRAALSGSDTVILQAAPGAGKSTAVPLELLNEPWLDGKKILMLEPRRLAARSVARRMADTLKEDCGDTVGYRVRFDNQISAKTKIEVLTEGILTRMIQEDPSLENTGLVIFDEFHERSLHADLALALCREAQQVLRTDLRILIMSATLDSANLSALLGNAPVITSTGRQFPIRYEYLNPDASEHIALQMSRAIRQAWTKEEGDILAFFPGAGEITRTKELLENSIPEALLYPLYGDLTAREQDKAIQPDPSGLRKIVLATSIAETSLTIEGIKVVVDCGLARVPKFDPRSGLSKLETIKVTQDAADQRAGRAGRLGPGVCYRLWTQASHQHLLPQRTPEILEADLSPTLLELARWGVTDVKSLSWLSPPPSASISQASDLLNVLEALSNGKISEEGKQLSRLPTHPRIARMLLKADAHDLKPLACDVAALLEERDPLPREQGADLSLRLDALRKYRRKIPVQADKNVLDRIERLSSQWHSLLKCKKEEQPADPYNIGQLLFYAYPERVARRREKENYRLANGRIARLSDKQDPLSETDWIVVAQLDGGSGEGKIFSAAPVDPLALKEKFTTRETLDWDYQKGVMISRSEVRYGEILVESKNLSNPDPEEKAQLLCTVIKKEGRLLFDWNEDIENIQARMISLAAWQPDGNWPDWSDEYLFTYPDEWILPYLSGIKKREDFEKLDIKTILQSTLSWDQQQKIDLLAPLFIEVPSGSNVKLLYKKDGSDPVLSVRLQELFGLPETPQINQGKTKVLIHLLSPGYKPVQVTQDLKSFWNNTYQEIRKELKIRYPKHSWPEDPWTAEAVRGAIRKRY
jgi:ATP-dependent helicase HrpB